MAIPDNLEDQVADLYFRQAEQDRRFANRERTGTVEEVDYEKGLYRVKLGEGEEGGEPFLSPWIRVKETAMGGKIKTHFPLAKDEQVKISSENGSLAEAEISQSMRSDDNRQISKKGDEARLRNDKSDVIVREKETIVSVGNKAGIVIREDRVWIVGGKISMRKSFSDAGVEF